MKIRNIYAALLSATAFALTSCSSDLNSETQNISDPNVTAKRAISISMADTRSVVSITDGNTWENGDLFVAYNTTTPANFDYLTAKGGGKTSKLQGEVECKNGDNIAIFFPYRMNYANATRGTVEIGMHQNSVSKNGSVITKQQDGTMETISYFDYSWGRIDGVSVSGNSAEGNVQMKKQYAILHLKFTSNGKPITNIKKLTIGGIIKDATFDLSSGTFSNIDKSGFTVTPSSQINEFDVAVFPESNFSPTFKVETSNNKVYTVSVSGKKIEAAKYYPITIGLKEYIPAPPYIEVGGIKWSKSNLQYTPGSQAEGWIDGYHLAENPWSYFYTEKSGYPLKESDLRGRQLSSSNTNGVEFDHFRWGDIINAHNYSSDVAGSYWDRTGSINGQISPNKQYGDLAAYASNGQWEMPTAQQFADLMAATGQYIGYYVDDSGNTIYGMLFDPTVSGNLKGKVLDKDNKVVKNSNKDAAPVNMSNKLRKFEKSDFEKALFFPCAGMYTYGMALEKPGNQGAYWLAIGGNANQAAAFITYINVNGQVFTGYTKSSINPKRSMYSIRPIYVGR